jgi:tRNA threonylcarbamoyladenosine biosynthesis protein TsaB
MAIILNIDTALETASVCLAHDEECIALLENNNQKDHASWLHVAIEKLVSGSGVQMRDIDAIAYSAGPGSYTGLRVGLSAAKGLCYALEKPLICVGTLEVIAHAAAKTGIDYSFLSTVIDARRMEIFRAIYDQNLKEIQPPVAHILDSNSFMTILGRGKVLFAGNAVNKVQKHIVHPNAIFNNVTGTAGDMALISLGKYMTRKFEDLAYTEPYYVKEFFNGKH